MNETFAVRKHYAGLNITGAVIVHQELQLENIQ